MLTEHGQMPDLIAHLSTKRNIDVTVSLYILSQIDTAHSPIHTQTHKNHTQRCSWKWLAVYSCCVKWLLFVLLFWISVTQPLICSQMFIVDHVSFEYNDCFLYKKTVIILMHYIFVYTYITTEQKKSVLIILYQKLQRNVHFSVSRSVPVLVLGSNLNKLCRGILGLCHMETTKLWSMVFQRTYEFCFKLSLHKFVTNFWRTCLRRPSSQVL